MSTFGKKEGREGRGRKSATLRFPEKKIRKQKIDISLLLNKMLEGAKKKKKKKLWKKKKRNSSNSALCLGVLKR